MRALGHHVHEDCKPTAPPHFTLFYGGLYPSEHHGHMFSGNTNLHLCCSTHPAHHTIAAGVGVEPSPDSASHYSAHLHMRVFDQRILCRHWLFGPYYYVSYFGIVVIIHTNTCTGTLKCSQLFDSGICTNALYRRHRFPERCSRWPPHAITSALQQMPLDKDDV